MSAAQNMQYMGMQLPNIDSVERTVAAAKIIQRFVQGTFHVAHQSTPYGSTSNLWPSHPRFKHDIHQGKHARNSSLSLHRGSELADVWMCRSPPPPPLCR